MKYTPSGVIRWLGRNGWIPQRVAKPMYKYLACMEHAGGSVFCLDTITMHYFSAVVLCLIAFVIFMIVLSSIEA
jgi:hypothetical protein